MLFVNAQSNLTDCFKLVSSQDGSTVGLSSMASNQSLEYSTDSSIWTNMTTLTSIPLDSGATIYIRGKLTSNNSETDYTQFTINGSVSASGNVNYIWDYDNLDAPLKDYCGYYLFSDCAGLITAPEFPSDTLSVGCYSGMFRYCTNLIEAPLLNATKLATACYQNMFVGCSNMTNVQNTLPAEALAEKCYWSMFHSCSSLTTAPALPATTLKKGCYLCMFKNCSSLKTAPVLPASILVDSCYVQLFRGCSQLNYIKCFATNISATDCLHDWVRYVPSNGTFVRHTNMNSWITGNSGIPSNWTQSAVTPCTIYFDANGGVIPDNGNMGKTPAKQLSGISLNKESGYVVVYNGEGIFKTMFNDCPTREGYTFLGWYTHISSGIEVYNDTGKYVSGVYWNEKGQWQGTSDIQLYAHWQVNSYTLTWLQDDGTVIDQTSVPYGQIPEHSDPTKDATAEFTYSFAGWSPNIVAVTGDAEYIATYTSTRNSYVITWKDEDGTIIDQTVVEYGQTPTHAEPTKAATAQYTFAFASWTPNVVAVTEDATYTATYKATIRKYNITFLDDDGSLISQQSIEYGQIPQQADPNKQPTARYTYVFTGWTPAVVAVTADATYMATYTSILRKYTITFLNDNGEVLSAEQWSYGETPTCPAPTKADDEQYTYTFAGWRPEVVAVVGEATYTATYTATAKPEGIEDPTANANAKAAKIFRNGQIFILRGDRVYTLQGQEVR